MIQAKDQRREQSLYVKTGDTVADIEVNKKPTINYIICKYSYRYLDCHTLIVQRITEQT